MAKVWEETELRLFYIEESTKRVLGTLSIVSWGKKDSSSVRQFTCRDTGVSFLSKEQAMVFIENKSKR